MSKNFGKGLDQRNEYDYYFDQDIANAMDGDKDAKNRLKLHNKSLYYRAVAPADKEYEALLAKLDDAVREKNKMKEKDDNKGEEMAVRNAAAILLRMKGNSISSENDTGRK